jgi:hypothetical protein
MALGCIARRQECRRKGDPVCQCIAIVAARSRWQPFRIVPSSPPLSGLFEVRRLRHRQQLRRSSVRQLRSARRSVHYSQNPRASRAGLRRRSRFNVALPFAPTAKRGLSVLFSFVQYRCPTMRWFRPPTGMRLLVRAAKALRRRHNAGVRLEGKSRRIERVKRHSARISEC